MFRFFPSVRAFATCVVALLLALFAYPALAGQASLAWNASASTNVTGYKVHYGMASASYATHVDVGNSLSATVPTLTPGATYYFAVTAYNSAGESGYSNEASATIPAADTQAPTVPSNPAAAANGSSAINLNWTGSTDNVGVAGYRVERCLGASCTSFAQVATPTSTSFADSGLTAGTAYRYRLRAVDAAGNLSGYSAVASASTSAEISSLAADFSANRTSGSAPMPVAFTEASSGTITGYAWTFGDGSTSMTKNPSHTYARAGTYSVSLSVTGGGGTKSITKSGYIKVGMDNDLVVDFGANYGIWQWLNNTNWAQLHGVTARQIAIADVDHNGQQDQVVDFGSRYGIWMRMNNANWTPLHWLSANWIVKADVDDNGQDDLVIDFGSRYGIWMYMNGNNWKTLHGTTAKQAIVADVDHNGRDDVVVDFGAAYGVWAYLNGTTWTRLDARSPNWMSKADVDHNGQDDLVMSFGAGTGSAQSYPGKGIWAYLNGSTWRQLDSRAVASTRGIAIDVDHDGQDDLVIDYGASGLWIYRNDTDWVQLHSAAGKSLAKADLDSNGQDDLVVDFGSRYGINVYMNGMGWAPLHGTTASSVTPGQVDGQ